ncbi:MAG: tRNA uridine-5-carboxymethylaminomethyl(34) synthesis GTPase MnmE [Clostridiales Family XIII bacterium]|jgi:tRNA modification GTPase|nr:tRNA uridine-5-carboxymethylaminomethyl(34) synthesis GTPase MnmE [Clostridiales Family XIII bacterium]
MNETIAAVSTAYGEGGIGIIRISGELSGEILDKLFRPYTGKTAHESRDRCKAPCDDEDLRPDKKLCFGHIADPVTEEMIDEVLAVFMHAPHTYTGEDVAEIQCHGSVVSLRKILSAVLGLGATAAPPGEFTKRAFLNGRIDLAQADAVIDVVQAKTDRGFESAVGQLSGSLSEQIRTIRSFLSDALAEMVVNLDYPDEDPDSDAQRIADASIRSALTEAKTLVKKLIESAQTGRMIRDGIRVVIAGKPNVGKSSLLNALLRESRAIVSEIPGTTRDSIEEYINVRGIPVRLTDTAGIRNAKDALEEQGVERSRAALDASDLVAFVVDGSVPLTGEDRQIAAEICGKPAVVLINKCDLPLRADTSVLVSLLQHAELISLSAVTGEGISDLEDYLVKSVYGGSIRQSESLLITNVRHLDALERTFAGIESAENMLHDGMALDFIEVTIREAYDGLGEITGDTVSDDILDKVFSRFCVGK